MTTSSAQRFVRLANDAANAKLNAANVGIGEDPLNARAFDSILTREIAEAANSYVLWLARSGALSGREKQKKFLLFAKRAGENAANEYIVGVRR